MKCVICLCVCLTCPCVLCEQVLQVVMGSECSGEEEAEPESGAEASNLGNTDRVQKGNNGGKHQAPPLKSYNSLSYPENEEITRCSTIQMGLVKL